MWLENLVTLPKAAETAMDSLTPQTDTTSREAS
ncbi:hypothetical protein MiSe_92980 [Microseira wollei NIES-4236]|uniref:Uncharacterized protein n=1 Tax=Microseira wollei NIES-4236 TaxID=2530354 RepID=A0AAV3WQI2_9CYAN|nr:hypothetical protein MiSe_92980 [Microseira wollei NIES-4236]